MATSNKTKAKRNLITVLVALAFVIVGIVGYSIYRNAQSSGGTVVTVGVVGNSDDAIWEAVQKELDTTRTPVSQSRPRLFRMASTPIRLKRMASLI